MPERRIKIVNELYSVRKSLHSLCPDIYFDRCKEWQEIIKGVAEEKGLDEIEAMIGIMKSLEGEAVAQMWVMAAYVELIEPLQKQ